MSADDKHTPRAEWALEVTALRKTYLHRPSVFAAPKAHVAVRDVSLRLAPGETLGLVGESGCGKSTLAKMILGLLRPDSGNVLVNGREVDATDRLGMARLIQPVFQDPNASLNPRKTVEEALRLPLDLHAEGTVPARRQRVREMLERVGLPERAARQYPAQLSGGQRQRVAIARALMLQPRVLICDEPTSALDVSVQAQILNLLLSLKTTLGLSYLFISHDLKVVEHVSDRVAVMFEGAIAEQGPAEALFGAPRHPYTQQLLGAGLSF